MVYPTIGKKGKRGFIKELLNPELKNPYNTSVLLLKDKLFALCEAGWPFALDAKTLESIGPDNLGELLKDETYSAHPKVDPDTGEIFNFGQVPYPPALCVYKSNKDGQITMRNKIPTKRLNMIHDCVIAGRYLVIMLPPLHLNVWKMALGIAPAADVMKCKPELGTEVFIFDRNDLSLVSKFVTEPFFAFHYANGYEEKDGTIYIELAKRENFEEIWEYLKAYPLGIDSIAGKISVTPELMIMRIDPKQGKVLEMKNVGDGEICEFPTVADAYVGKDWRYSLYVTSNPHKKCIEAGELPQTIARFDRKHQKAQIFHYGPHIYFNEPLLVSSEEDPEQGYILNLAFDAEKSSSELWVHHTKSFEGEPLCKIRLPEIIPFGFHGRYYSA